MGLDYTIMTKEERNACALIAAEAFYDYEYFSIYVPDDARRRRFLDTLIKLEFRANWSSPEAIFITARDRGRVVAVAQLCTPAFKKPTDFKYIRTGWIDAMMKGGPRRAMAWNDMERLASAPCHNLSGKNWYLSLLTVAKSAEGKGIGTRFLNEYLIPYAKNAGGETFSLFTNSEINRAFYEKNGFTMFDEQHFEFGGKRIGNWSYVKEL